MCTFRVLGLLLALGAASACSIYDGDGNREAEPKAELHKRTLTFEAFGPEDHVKAECVANFRGAGAQFFEYIQGDFLPRLSTPAVDIWTVAANSQGGVRLALRIPDGNRGHMSELYALLSGLSPPKKLPLFLEAPQNLSTTPFSRRNVSDDLFWDIIHEPLLAPYSEACTYLQAWLKAQQVLRGKKIAAKTKVVKVQCVIELAPKAAVASEASTLNDLIQVSRLPIPWVDTVTGAFPILRLEDCSAKSLVRKLKI